MTSDLDHEMDRRMDRRTALATLGWGAVGLAGLASGCGSCDDRDRPARIRPPLDAGGSGTTDQTVVVKETPAPVKSSTPPGQSKRLKLKFKRGVGYQRVLRMKRKVHYVVDQHLGGEPVKFYITRSSSNPGQVDLDTLITGQYVLGSIGNTTKRDPTFFLVERRRDDNPHVNLLNHISRKTDHYVVGVYKRGGKYRVAVKHMVAPGYDKDQPRDVPVFGQTSLFGKRLKFLCNINGPRYFFAAYNKRDQRIRSAIVDPNLTRE